MTNAEAIEKFKKIKRGNIYLIHQSKILKLDAYQVMVENGEGNPYAWARLRMSELPSAQSEQQHGRVFKGIFVRYPEYCIYPEYKGKPYFSIKYTENGQEFIGYSTYKLEVLSEYLKEYFMPPVQPEIVRCKDCKYCDRGIDEDGNPFLKCLGWVYGGTQEEDFCSHAERRTDEGD